MDGPNETTSEVRQLPRMARGRWPKRKELIIMRILEQNQGGLFPLDICARSAKLSRWGLYVHLGNTEKLGLIFATRVDRGNGNAGYRYQLTPMGFTLVSIARDMHIEEDK